MIPNIHCWYLLGSLGLRLGNDIPRLMEKTWWRLCWTGRPRPVSVPVEAARWVANELCWQFGSVYHHRHLSAGVIRTCLFCLREIDLGKRVKDISQIYEAFQTKYSELHLSGYIFGGWLTIIVPVSRLDKCHRRLQIFKLSSQIVRLLEFAWYHVNASFSRKKNFMT